MVIRKELWFGFGLMALILLWRPDGLFKAG